jgi:DNA helicase-2/ATP-dependent DNA helicase PcrA
VKYVLKTTAPRQVAFDLQRDLNPQQRAVVEAAPGKILVIAGAGTGKTRTLTYRMARLVQAGCRPERILLCTFTNRAAREMVSRVEGLLGLDMQRCAAGTFHHIGNRILRRFGDRIGLGSDFGILDPEDTRGLLASVVAEQGLEVLTARRFPQPKVLHGLIGLASGTRVPLSTLVQARAPQLCAQLPAIENVAQRFAERKRQSNVCDFDDLLVHWGRLVTDPELAEVAAELQDAYDHVLVDEYQDINALQGTLCDAMAARSGSLTAVGDDAQSIYAFRGADFGQISEFERRHPDATVLELTINYRSTPEILNLANRSIANNPRQHFKQLQSVKQPGMTPAVIPLRDVYQQAELVAQRVLELHHEQSLPLSKMAVLYRNHSHSLELQVELTRRQIPYMVRSGVRFFEQAHIKDVVAYLRARDNPRDEVAWVRLLRQWPGVGLQTAERLAAQFAGRLAGDPASPAILTPSPSWVPEALDEAAVRVRGRGRTALERLATLWRRLAEPEQHGPGAAIREIVEAHYAEYAERSFTNAATRREDLEHLAGYAGRYPDPREFLSELALVQGMAAENVMGGEAADDFLVLSTVHQAKGLEWPICFILWVVDGRFPSSQAIRTPSELEEERRLFYVACTRAADELYMCYPTVEDGRDGPSRLLRPSRFLVELDRSPVVFDRWQIEEEPL